MNTLYSTRDPKTGAVRHYGCWRLRLLGEASLYLRALREGLPGLLFAAFWILVAYAFGGLK